MHATTSIPRTIPQTARPHAGAHLLTESRVIWAMTFVSLTAYLLDDVFGSLALGLCIAIWALYALAYPARVLAWLATAPLIWAFPLLALASTLWSIEPVISLRLSIELTLFTAIGRMMASVQPMRHFLSALLCSLLLCIAASLVFGTTAPVGFTGEIAFIGLFGSKNNFAFVICLMMFSAASVLLDTAQHRGFRALGALGVGASPILLIKTISLGALVSSGFGCASLGAVVVLAMVRPHWRGAFLLGVLAVMLAIGAVAGIAVSQGINIDTLLVGLGKDPSLTGRTFLWGRAQSFMAERPWFGLGYQAFWVQGHVEAEGLWRFADIDSRAGFHFHNLFYAVGVELGGAGIAVLAIELLATIGIITAAALLRPHPTTAFLVALFAFFMIRMSVELDFLTPFSYGSLIIPAGWTFAAKALSQPSTRTP